MSTLPGGHTPTSDSVGRDGVQNFGQGRDAAPGSGGGRRGRRRGRGGRGEQAMVPDVEFTSYYGRPILKASPWTADIPAYLFTGGLAGGSALLAAGADLTGRPALRRTGRVGALGALAASMVLLVHDLGRPSRFLNMLRVAKVTSPMSVGTWILSLFAPFAGLAAAAEFRNLLPRPLARVSRLLAVADRPAGLAAAAVGPAVMSYTAVLMSDTATPSWHEGYREMPFVFVGSAFVASGGLGMLAAPVDQAGPARRMAVAGAVARTDAPSTRWNRPWGSPPSRSTQGTAGVLMRISKALTGIGAVGALFGGRSRRISAASGAALLSASACTRFAIFHAGQAVRARPQVHRHPAAQASRRAPRRRLTAAGWAGG